jgi:hypothetical protein
MKSGVIAAATAATGENSKEHCQPVARAADESGDEVSSSSGSGQHR